jgi:hypothetical protein
MKKTKSTVQTIDLLDLDVDNLNITPARGGNSVKEIKCFHKLEYLTGPERISFMEEAWRILEVGGKLNVIVCYWTSPRSIQDPLLQWPPMSEQSFLYFNRGWREAQHLSVIKCDFDFSYGYIFDPETASKNTETQAFWMKHYTNTATDLQVALVKRA